MWNFYVLWISHNIARSQNIIIWMVDIVHDLMLIALIEIVYSSHVDLKFWDDMFTSHVHEVCEDQYSNRIDMKEKISLHLNFFDVD